MTDMAYEKPTSVEEASRALLASSDSLALSGGTDLAVAIRHGRSSPSVLVDLKGIPDLAPSISSDGNSLRITANTVMSDLERDQGVRETLPGLVEAAEVVGSVQIRNRATLAGNLCNASPAADTPPVLMALNATVEVRGPEGDKLLSVDDFLRGYRETALLPGEVVTAVMIPVSDRVSGSAFLKLGVRRAMEISIVCVGAVIELDGGGRVVSAGIGLGSVAATTIRARSAEAVLEGADPTDDVFAHAGELAAQDCSPIDDLRASGDYRRAMVPVIVRRALAAAYERARARP